MSLDIYDEEVIKTSEEYMQSLQDSLRDKLSKGQPCNPAVQILSDYIRMTLKDLRQLILKYDDKGTCIWNATVLPFTLHSKHMAAGVYKVWLTTTIKYRQYCQALGKPLCSFNDNCGSVRKDGLYCKDHFGRKCKYCGNQATHSCNHSLEWCACGIELCDSCNCTH